jgi:hypothetical protein
MQAETGIGEGRGHSGSERPKAQMGREADVRRVRHQCLLSVRQVLMQLMNFGNEVLNAPCILYPKLALCSCCRRVLHDFFVGD